MKLSEILEGSYRDELLKKTDELTARANKMADENERTIAKTKRTVKSLRKKPESRPEIRPYS